MRKKIMAALLAGVMVLAVGCGGKGESGNVTLGEYKGLTLTSVSQATVDAELNSMLASYTEYVTVADGWGGNVHGLYTLPKVFQMPKDSEV